MRLRNLIVGTLLVSVIASGNITNPNIATATENTDSNTEITTTVTPIPEVTKNSTHPTSFTDVKKGDTYYTAVNYLAKKGALGGYKDGKFKVSTKMTYAKFVGVLMRTIDPTLPRATKGKDYDNKAIEAAYKAGIIKYSEVSDKDYTKSITRQDMVLYLSRALEYLDKDVVLIQDISNLIPDFHKIDDTKYEEAVKELYSAGIFTGTSKTNEFKPTAKVGRGTAINAILKVVEPKYRKNMSKVTIPSTTTEARETRVLKWNDADRGLAKIGDTWQAKDGKKTKLKGIEWNGTTVPGYGQGIDLYSGLVSDGGVTLKVGKNGGFYHRDTTYSGQKLQQAKSHKGVTFTYFRDQWLIIEQYELKIADKVKNPKDGQYAEGTHFFKYYKDIGMWCWEGPVY